MLIPHMHGGFVAFVVEIFVPDLKRFLSLFQSKGRWT